MRTIPLALFTGLLCGSGANAGPCVTALLSNYIALGSSGCQVDGLTVKDFGYSLISSTVTIAAADITVTPVFPAGGVGLDFSSSKFNISGSDSAKYLLVYTWDPGTIRSLEDILNTSTPVFPGFAQITTDACTDAAFSGSSCPNAIATIIVSHNGLVANLTASTNFSPPIGIVGIRNTIELDANGASSQFNDFSNILFLPEPSTILGGFCALGLLLLRRIQSR